MVMLWLIRPWWSILICSSWMPHPLKSTFSHSLWCCVRKHVKCLTSLDDNFLCLRLIVLSLNVFEFAISLQISLLPPSKKQLKRSMQSTWLSDMWTWLVAKNSWIKRCAKLNSIVLPVMQSRCTACMRPRLFTDPEDGTISGHVSLISAKVKVVFLLLRLSIDKLPSCVIILL